MFSLKTFFTKQTNSNFPLNECPYLTSSYLSKKICISLMFCGIVQMIWYWENKLNEWIFTNFKFFIQNRIKHIKVVLVGTITVIYCCKLRCKFEWLYLITYCVLSKTDITLEQCNLGHIPSVSIRISLSKPKHK